MEPNQELTLVLVLIILILLLQLITILFVFRKCKTAANITKLILTLDDIVFIDTQVSRKVRNLLLMTN